ncbi:MAG: PcfJ-like protein, partial [Phycisphaerales bacterium]|nr:PcfJ-like protein [Phycisphaerales bacterium]
MDLERTYNNTRLEARRKELLNAQHLAAILRNNKRGKRSAVDDVNDALDGPRKVSTPRARAIVRAVKAYDCRWRPDDRLSLLRLFRVIAENTRLLDIDKELPDRLYALVAMAAECKRWIRDPDSWVCRTHNAGRQFSQIARHLFARYDVPAWLDQAWFDRTRRKRDHGRAMWFIFVGQGGNLRKAGGLPIAMTKMMAHHAMQAPV